MRKCFTFGHLCFPDVNLPLVVITFARKLSHELSCSSQLCHTDKNELVHWHNTQSYKCVVSQVQMRKAQTNTDTICLFKRICIVEHGEEYNS